jgi:hypothetical protein
MRLRLPFLLPAGEVPDFDDAVATATSEMLERIGVLGEGVYTVYVSRFEVAEERLRKHALNFCRIEGSGVFSRTFKRMQVGVEVPRDFGDTGARGLCGSRRPAEGLDLHRGGCPAVETRRRELCGSSRFPRGSGGASQPGRGALRIIVGRRRPNSSDQATCHTPFLLWRQPRTPGPRTPSLTRTTAKMKL